MDPVVNGVPLKLWILTVTEPNGRPVAASVTVPLIRPPCTKSKSIPVVAVPTVTVMGVPPVTLQELPGQGMLSNSSSMYPSEFDVRA